MAEVIKSFGLLYEFMTVVLLISSAQQFPKRDGHRT